MLILDEAPSALDAATEHKLELALDEVMRVPPIDSSSGGAGQTGAAGTTAGAASALAGSGTAGSGGAAGN